MMKSVLTYLQGHDYVEDKITTISCIFL